MVVQKHHAQISVHTRVAETLESVRNSDHIIAPVGHSMAIGIPQLDVVWLQTSGRQRHRRRCVQLSYTEHDCR